MATKTTTDWKGTVDQLCPVEREGYAMVRRFLMTPSPESWLHEPSHRMKVLRGVIAMEEILEPPLPEAVIEVAHALSADYSDYIQGPGREVHSNERDDLEAATQHLLEIIFEHGYRSDGPPAVIAHPGKVDAVAMRPSGAFRG